jgi:hypothetical protein
LTNLEEQLRRRCDVPAHLRERVPHRALVGEAHALELRDLGERFGA